MAAITDHHPVVSLPLTTLYPELVGMSMDQIVDLSRRHLKRDVIRRAADAARAHFAAHPSDRVNLDAVAEATGAAFEAPSLIHFLQTRADAIVERVQPSLRQLVPPP